MFRRCGTFYSPICPIQYMSRAETSAHSLTPKIAAVPYKAGMLVQARPLRAKTLQWLGFEIAGRRIYAVTRSQYVNVNVSFVGNYPAVSFSLGCLSSRLLMASSRDVRGFTRRNTQFEDSRCRLSRSGPTEQANRRQPMTPRAQHHPQDHPRAAPRVAGINAVVTSC